MIEYKPGYLFNGEPFGIIIIRDLLLIFIYINQCKVGEGDGSFNRVPAGVTKAMQFLKVYIGKACQIL